jgi:hypothetical protein
MESARHGPSHAISQNAQRLRLNAHHVFTNIFHGRKWKKEDVSTPALQK